MAVTFGVRLRFIFIQLQNEQLIGSTVRQYIEKATHFLHQSTGQADLVF